MLLLVEGPSHCYRVVVTVSLKVQVVFTESLLLLVEGAKKKTTRSGPYPRTRSPVRTRIEVQHRPIKLSRETPVDSTAGAASNKFIQKKFMEMIGWVNREINIDHEEVLSKEVGSIIACANMHSYYPRNHTDGTDGYYTSEEVNNYL